MKAMKAAASTNVTAAEKKAAAKKVLKAALGESDISDTKLEEFIEDGAKSAVKKAMSACAATADDETNPEKKIEILQACKSNSAKSALSEALGKSASEVTQTDVEAFVRNAAKTAVADAMKAAVEDDSISDAERKVVVKKTLAQSLGVSAIDDTSFEFYIKKGAETAIVDSVKSCVDAAKQLST